MSFGTGGFVCKSSKQKLNAKSSTEAEVVGASDYLPNTPWIQMVFLAAQGYELESNYFEQDNEESAMKFEKNGRMSAGQKSRCWLIFLQNHSKDTCFVGFAIMSSWDTVTLTPCASAPAFQLRCVLKEVDPKHP